MSRVRHITWPLLLVALAMGCSETEEPEIAPISVWEGTVDSCDAGDEAFIKRAIPFLWGRRATSIREVELLVDTVRQTSRGAVIRAMMRTPAFVERWRLLLRSVPQRGIINRDDECEGLPLLDEVTPELAEHVRDNGPETPFRETFNLADLAASAVALDDISVWYRGTLFTLHRLPIDFENPAEELALRLELLDVFETYYLKRRTACVSCHNAEYSTTGSPDPERDRTWELPGLLEAAIYGSSYGRPERDLAAIFRTHDVMSIKPVPDGYGPPWWQHDDGYSGWGISPVCGSFLPPTQIPPDSLGDQAYLAGQLPDNASIWDLERLYRTGFATLREFGLRVGDDGTVAGDAALAYLTSAAFVEFAWTEVGGWPLTVAHGFARNKEQRDILQALTERFIRTGFSLEALMEAILLHPFWNRDAPSTCPDDPIYAFPPIFDPWVIEDHTAERRGNSVGELIQRLPPWVLVKSATTALEWPEIEPYLSEEEGGDMLDLAPQSSFLQDIGITIDTVAGFRSSNFGERLAWEEAVGACTDPAAWFESLAGHEVPLSTDWIDRLVAAAGPQHTFEDAVVALKDRLVTIPDLSDPEERSLVADLGMSLETPIAADREASTAALRRVCVALLLSPQFMMAGTAEPPRAGTELPLVVPGQDRAAYCESLASTLGNGEWASCRDGNLVVR